MDRSKNMNDRFKEICYLRSYTGSGATWLFNFFLEVGVCVSVTEKLTDTWEICIDNSLSLSKYSRNLSIPRLAPIFGRKQRFDFYDSVLVHASHDYPVLTNLNNKVILLVRDVRDVLYSQYKRDKKECNNLTQYLHLYWEPFGMSQQSTWALFNFLWMNFITPDKLHVIKFEDIKLNPIPTMKSLLEFVGVKVDDEKIVSAILNSSFTNAHKHELMNRKDTDPLITQGGLVGEWKNVYSKEDLRLFHGFSSLLLEKLDYFNEECNNNLSDDIIRLDGQKSPCFNSRRILLKEIVQELKLVKSESDIIKKGRLLVYDQWIQNISRDKISDELFAHIFPIFIKLPIIDDGHFNVCLAKALFSHKEKMSLKLLEKFIPEISDKRLLLRITFLLFLGKRFFKSYELFKKIQGSHLMIHGIKSRALLYFRLLISNSILQIQRVSTKK